MSQPPNDLDDDDDRPPIPWGDYGTIILAAIFSLTGLYLIFGPSPFANIKLPKAPPPAQIQPVQVPPSQEVTIGIGGGSAIHPPRPTGPTKPQ